MRLSSHTDRLCQARTCRLAGLGQPSATRRFSFDVERAIFLTVLHRLIAPGSDRAAERWKQDYAVAGTEALGLH